MREQRKQDHEKHYEAIKAELQKQDEIMEEVGVKYGKDGGDDEESEEDEWDGLPDAQPIPEDEDYVDEDKYTTVTVSAMEDDALEEEEEEEARAAAAVALKKKAEEEEAAARKKKGGRKGLDSSKKKEKKKKFRYESKAERKVTRFKQKAKNAKAAKARKGE